MDRNQGKSGRHLYDLSGNRLAPATQWDSREYHAGHAGQALVQVTAVVVAHELRGAQAEQLIDQVAAAARSYPLPRNM
jgi:hypothetical protein